MLLGVEDDEFVVLNSRVPCFAVDAMMFLGRCGVSMGSIGNMRLAQNSIDGKHERAAAFDGPVAAAPIGITHAGVARRLLPVIGKVQARSEHRPRNDDADQLFGQPK